MSNATLDFSTRICDLISRGLSQGSVFILPLPRLTVFCSVSFSFLVACRAAEEAMISDLDENNPGTEWERVARLCDFNPKSSKQAKDVSRMRSVLISLKQSPLVR